MLLLILLTHVGPCLATAQLKQTEILSPRPAGQYGAVALNMRGQIAVQTDSAAFLSLRGRWQTLPEPKHRYGYRQILSLSDDGTAFMASSQMNEVGATIEIIAYTVSHGKVGPLPRQKLLAQPNAGQATTRGRVVWCDGGTNNALAGGQPPRTFLSSGKKDSLVGRGENPHINSSGQICYTDPHVSNIDVGESPNDPTAFLWNKGVGRTIAHGVASDIDEAGDIVGYSSTSYDQGLEPEGRTTCWMYSRGTVHMIGSLGLETPMPVSLNDNGDFVGVAGSDHDVPFLYRKGKIFNLNRIKTGKGPEITGVSRIDNKGEILCFSEDQSGKYRYFLLVPLGR